jgi:phosphoglycerol transferase MdoB-like AlkP superfamily enzyme
MKNSIYFLVKQFAFWLFVFAMERMVFMLFYQSLIAEDQISFSDILLVFVNAFKLDISTASYLLLVPFILEILTILFNSAILRKITNYFNYLVLLIYLMISAGEIGLYGEWKTKLSYKALVYFRNPSEVFKTATFWEITSFFLLVFIQLWLFMLIYNRFIKSRFSKCNSSVIIKLTTFVLLMGLLVIGLRGGIQAIPITASDAYFSKHNILNVAAVNSGYNLAFGTIDYFQIKDKNIFKTLPEEEANAIVDDILFVPSDTTVSILKVSHPNIVIVLLESFSGDLIETLGGRADIAPEFHKLEKEGLMFTEFYATGNRSQQAIGSLFAGLPAIPLTTLTDHPEKYKSVPSFIKVLNDEGYFTSFYFGGDLNYGNIKSYLLYNEFDKLVDETNFDDSYPKGRLGYHDQYMFGFYHQELNKMQQPFFSTVFTLSSHSPYDQPGDHPIQDIKLEKNFVNAAHYTDKWLGDFFNKVKNEPWYDSTLFLILADHSHVSYLNRPLGSFGYHKIPLLITGGALVDSLRGKQYNKVTANVNIPTTLLHQLKLSSKPFRWSLDMFNPNTPEFAYFELNSGYGWKRPQGEMVQDIINNHFHVKKCSKKECDKLEKEGRSYIQVLFDEFLNY